MTFIAFVFGIFIGPLDRQLRCSTSTNNSDIAGFVQHTDANRFSGISAISGNSGISNISAISGTGIGDSSFSGAYSDEEKRDLRLVDIQLEV